MKKLQMQLVPQQCHGRNLRAILKKQSWDKLSKAVRSHQGKCQTCGGSPDHCHEVWEWVVSEGDLVQRLVGLDAACKDCHDFMHFGRVVALETSYRQDKVIGHAISVLMCDADWMINYCGKNFLANEKLSKFMVANMDLEWIHRVPAGEIGLIPSVWAIIWDEIDQYIDD